MRRKSDMEYLPVRYFAALKAFLYLCYIRYIQNITQHMVCKAALAWEFLFSVHAPVIRGSKKRGNGFADRRIAVYRIKRVPGIL